MTEDKKDANGGLSTQSKQRKTLKLKDSSSNSGNRKRLGVGSVSSSSSGDIASQHSKSSTRSGTVVVVTKSKNSATTDISKGGALNDDEIQRKLDILKNASQNRRQAEEASKTKEQVQEVQEEQQEIEEALSNSDREVTDSKIISEIKEEALLDKEKEKKSGADIKKDKEVIDESNNKRQKYRARASNKNYSDSIKNSDSKIRNLDSLGRNKRSKKETQPSKEGEVTLETTIQQHGKNQKDSEDKKNNTNSKVRGKGNSASNSFNSNYLLDEEEENTTSNKKRGNRDKSGKNDDKKISIAQLLKLEEENADDVFMPRGIRSIRAFKNKGKSFSKTEREKIIKTVSIYEGITVQEIASAMSEKVSTVIKKLMSLGIMATINQSLDVDTAEILVGEMGHVPSVDMKSDLEESVISKIRSDERKDYKMEKRPPIVTIMGHVDHGKTSLLDAYRQSRVVEGEAGGITQHIAAYQVEYNDSKITFLDTPGHAAFTAMRLRGAMVTDIVVIIVAADDGVMEQTIEAINHAKAAEVPIIVAINKIDKPDSNPERVKTQLLHHNLIPEDMGGDIMVVQISAVKKMNLDELLDAILLQSEICDLEVPYNRPAVGSVVESRMERLHGVTTTLLLKKGSLKIGDILIAGKSWGRVKNIYDDLGRPIKSATPSMPVEVIGFSTAPTAGDEFLVLENEKQAKDIIDYRIANESKSKASKRSATTLENLMKSNKNQEIRQLNVLIKADVHGSMEAIAASLQKIATDEVKVNVIHQAVGGITESDVTLALASNAIIIGFNVRAPSSVAQIAKNNQIEIRYYSIIYQLIDDIKMAASGLLDPIQKEEITGYAEIREIFNLSKFGKVAGCYVTSGFINRDAQLRVIRDEIVIYTGNVKALKRFKDDVKQVKSGFECGISIDKFDDIKVGDKFEAFIIKEEKRTL